MEVTLVRGVARDIMRFSTVALISAAQSQDKHRRHLMKTNDRSAQQPAEGLAVYKNRNAAYTSVRARRVLPCRTDQLLFNTIPGMFVF